MIFFTAVCFIGCNFNRGDYDAFQGLIGKVEGLTSLNPDKTIALMVLHKSAFNLDCVSRLM